MTSPNIKLTSEDTSLGKQHFAVLPDGRKFIVEDPQTFQDRIKESRARLERGQLGLSLLPPPPTTRDVAESVSLAAYQTPIKNQGDRGSCWAFAGVAALEAAYKRRYGLTLDLSEQYTFHLGKCSELYTDYITSSAPHENNSSYWGAQGCSDVVDKMSRAAIPEERFAPYQFQAELSQIRQSLGIVDEIKWETTQEVLDKFEFSHAHIPLEARLNAKYRVTGYGRLLDTNIETLEHILRSGYEIVADANWGHVILLVGYDRQRRIFQVKNSWGGDSLEEWSYDQVAAEIIDGYFITDISNPNESPQLKAMWLGQWNMDHDGWRGNLVIRRFTNFRASDPNTATKLGNYYRDGKRHDANGYFTDNGRGLVFYVADTTDKVQPGTLTGQKYEIYLYSWDPCNSAGNTEWEGAPYGTIVSRGTIPGISSTTFKANEWKGQWEMNHDGWRGRLEIESVIRLPFAPAILFVNGFYHTSDGRKLNVTGTLPNSRPHLLTIQIPFSNDNKQRFDLMYHTWEDKVFSGVTYWGGKKFGVCGFKR